MNRRNFLTGIRNFAIGLAISPSLERFIPEILPAETRVPPRLDESLTIANLNTITRREIFPQLIEDYFFTPSPFEAYILTRYGGMTEEDRPIKNFRRIMQENV